MSVWPVFDHNFFVAWSSGMITALWQGSLMLFVVWGVIRLFPRSHPAVQCWMWRLVYLKFLITLFGLKPFKLLINPQIGLRQIGWVLLNSCTTRHLAKMTKTVFGANLPHPISWEPILWGGTLLWFLLWLAGLICGAFVLWRLHHHERTLQRICVPLRDPRIVNRYHELGRRNRFRKMPQLLISNRIQSPLLQGILRPRIILPAAMVAKFEPEELQAVLAHELAHYQRGDLLWNWLPTLARTFFFFLPFMRWVEKKLGQLQEICCDRLAVQYTNTPADKFGRMLLKVSLRQKYPPPKSFSAGFASQSIDLLKFRLQALRSAGPINRKRVTVTGAMLLLLAIFAVVPWQLAQTEILPFNMWISYFDQDKLEISAHVILPEKKVMATEVFIDDNQVYSTYNSSDIYSGYFKPKVEHIPFTGPHKVTVKAITDNGTIMEHNWIYFQKSMNWSNEDLGLGNDQTVIKIGPLFWIIKKNFFTGSAISFLRMGGSTNTHL